MDDDTQKIVDALGELAWSLDAQGRKADSLTCTRAAIWISGTRPEESFREAMEILRSIEFTTVVHSKCPVCLGWEGKGSGETSRHHNATCRLSALLKRYPEAK